MNNDYKSNFIISQYYSLEKQLQQCMEYIPFVETNKEVISPKFVSVIMESCSLIDSIFYDISASSGERFNLKKYSEMHEEMLNLEESITLFFTTPIELLNPYADWTNKQPNWWNAYNKVKHDRINNINLATYNNAVLSLAGLHQLIARNPMFISGFLKYGWIDTNHIEILEGLSGVANVGIRHIETVVESEMFASPTLENFILSKMNDRGYFEVDYEITGLSNRIRNFIFAHEDF